MGVFTDHESYPDLPGASWIVGVQPIGHSSCSLLALIMGYKIPVFSEVVDFCPEMLRSGSKHPDIVVEEIERNTYITESIDIAFGHCETCVRSLVSQKLLRSWIEEESAERMC